MNKINYDFSEFIAAFSRMRVNCTATPDDLRLLKEELNKFFTDSKCKEVMYTNNTDKMFFGIKLVPVIDADDVYDYMVDNEPRRIEGYIVELDSKLLDPIVDLSSKELLAVLLHEVGHLVGDSQPVDDARKALDLYLAGNRDNIKITQSIHYKEILAYGLKDFLSKSQSMFYNPDSSEIYADEMAATYGFADELSSAYDKLMKNNIKLYENCNVSKFITFSWTLTIYKNLKVHRVGAIRLLTSAIQLTGSRLERMEMQNVIRRIMRIDDDALLEAGSLKLKLKEKMRKSRLNNIKSIENTYYELNMQVKNVEDEEDALYIMRQLNTSISILDDYRSSPDCDDYEAEKIDATLTKLKQLREKLTSTVVYKNKNYGLFVNYPDIVENRY